MRIKACGKRIPFVDRLKAGPKGSPQFFPGWLHAESPRLKVKIAMRGGLLILENLSRPEGPGALRQAGFLALQGQAGVILAHFCHTYTGSCAGVFVR